MSTYNNRISSWALKEDLRATADRLDKTPTMREYREHGVYSPGPMIDRFGSWNSAIEEAGLDVNRRWGTPREELVEDLASVGESLGRSPSMAEYDRYGDYSAGALKHRFDTWNDALEEAGLERRPADRPAGAATGSELTKKLEELDPSEVP